jgi:hypothetical protein
MQIFITFLFIKFKSIYKFFGDLFWSGDQKCYNETKYDKCYGEVGKDSKVTTCCHYYSYGDYYFQSSSSKGCCQYNCLDL